LKETLERESKQNNELATANEGLMEDKRNTTAENKLGEARELPRNC